MTMTMNDERCGHSSRSHQLFPSGQNQLNKTTTKTVASWEPEVRVHTLDTPRMLVGAVAQVDTIAAACSNGGHENMENTGIRRETATTMDIELASFVGVRSFSFLTWRVFITKGPCCTTGSFVGSPHTSTKSAGLSKVLTVTPEPSCISG